MSTYTGNISQWIDFLSAWAKQTPPPSPAIDQTAYQNALAKKLPKSFVDFYFAMDALGWPELLKVEPEAEDAVFEFVNIQDLRVGPLKSTIPEPFLGENYRVYDASQEEVAPFISTDDFEEMLKVADYQDVVFDAKIYLNPYVQFENGEWEAAFLDIQAPYEVRFSSFADLVVWLYLHHPASGVALPPNVLYADHRQDTSGLSRPLFA